MTDIEDGYTMMLPSKRRRITVTASVKGTERARSALTRLGFESISNFAKAQLMGKSTVDKFFNRQPIQLSSFKRICNGLKISDWENLVELEPVVEQTDGSHLLSHPLREMSTIEESTTQPVVANYVATPTTIPGEKSKKIKVIIVLEGDIDSVNAKVQGMIETSLKNASGDTITITHIQAGSIKITVLGSVEDITNLANQIASEELIEINGFSIKGIQILAPNLLRADESESKWEIVSAIINKSILRSELRGTDLSDTDLSNADLSNADLSNADLSNADLSNADLSNADLSNADLSNTRARATANDLARALASNLANDLANNLTTASANASALARYVASANDLARDLADASDLARDLARDLSLDLDLARATDRALSNALDYASANAASELALAISFDRTRASALANALANARDRARDLDFARVRASIAVNFSNANLSGANFSNADLNSANFSDANLSGAIVENAYFGEGFGLSDSEKRDLKQRGAIFDESTGSRSSINSPSPVRR